MMISLAKELVVAFTAVAIEEDYTKAAVRLRAKYTEAAIIK